MSEVSSPVGTIISSKLFRVVKTKIPTSKKAMIIPFIGTKLPSKFSATTFQVILKFPKENKTIAKAKNKNPKIFFIIKFMKEDIKN